MTILHTQVASTEHTLQPACIGKHLVSRRLWMEKQEAAFAAWLNSVLVPASSAEEGAASQALAARRLTAKVRGLLWHLYSADSDVISTMLKVEKHIDAGQLRLKDEVSL